MYFVQTAILPLAEEEDDERERLQTEMETKYSLSRCLLVSGSPSMLTNSLDQPLREHIVDQITNVAAKTVFQLFERDSDPRLAVTFGLVGRKIADYVSMQQGVHRNREPAGYVLAAQGVRKGTLDRFDANDIARSLARHLGCYYACMPIPAMVKAEHVEIVKEMRLVREMIDHLAKANLLATSLTGIHNHHHSKPDIPPERFAFAMSDDLEEPGDAQYFRTAGAVGNIGGWWFDIEADSVPYPRREMIGLGTHAIQDIARSGHVVLAVGADPLRIPAIAVALGGKQKLADIWIGDTETARVLLGHRELRFDPEGGWTREERRIFRQLVNRDAIRDLTRSPRTASVKDV